MLKLSISASLIAHTVSATINYGMSIFNQINADETLTAMTKEENEKQAKDLNIPLEKIEKNKENINKDYVEALTEFSTNYRNKMNFENKFLKTEMNDEDFTLEIKEEFLTDIIDNVFICYEKLIPVFIKIIPVFKTINDIDKSFKDKWYTPKVKKETTTTVETEVLNTVFSSNGWDFTIKKYNEPKALVLKDGESTVMVDGFVVLNKETKAGFKVNSYMFEYVLNDDTDILAEYPKSLQAALKDLLTEYYKVEM